MKTLLATLLIATLCATGYGQTIKSLGYNATNGEVVYTSTNTLTFTNAPAFTDAATVRTNLGLGATNDVIFNTGYFANATDGTFQIRFGATNTGFQRTGGGQTALIVVGNNIFSFTTNAITINAANGIAFATNAAPATRTNLGIPLPALTNTNNADTMRALAGSTNTNEPFSGTLSWQDYNDDTVSIVVSNGIILSVSEP
jgi:hypothetical protein